MALLVVLHQFGHIDLCVGYEIVRWYEGTVEQGEMHQLRILDALCDSLAPDRADCLLLGHSSAEKNVVEIYHEIRVHVSKCFASRENNGFEVGRLNDVYGHCSSEVLLTCHDDSHLKGYQTSQVVQIFLVVYATVDFGFGNTNKLVVIQLASELGGGDRNKT